MQHKDCWLTYACLVSTLLQQARKKRERMEGEGGAGREDLMTGRKKQGFSFFSITEASRGRASDITSGER